MSAEALSHSRSAPALSWETGIPIASHPVMLANFGMLFAVLGATAAALCAFVLAMTGDAASIEPVLEWIAAGTAGAFLLALLIATIIFGNRLHMRFRLDREAAEAEVSDERAAIVRRATAIFSWVANRFGLAGSGLIAETSTPKHIAWDTVALAHFHPLWRTVSLSNGWRIVLILFCTQQNYAEVANMVHESLALRAPHSVSNPLPALFLRSFLVLLCSMPLFAMPFVEKDGVFPALLILGCALGAVWLVPRLAFIVLIGIGWSVVLEVDACTKLRDSLFGGTYRAYQVLNMGDAITLALALSGVACLIVLSLGILAGRWRSGLAPEMVERNRSRP